jgi:NAD(P)-dependent dehydrogenase (short-subunit alcohol dehydrogenase family)
VTDDGRPYDGVICLPGSPMDVAAALRRTDGPLWCVTRDAVATRPGDPVDPAQAMIWGLGRVAALEQPARWGGLIDLPGAVDDRFTAGLAARLGGTEDQVAVRAGGILGRRLRHAPAGGAPAAPWRTSGTWLVTGGTGGVGAIVAGWLARSGAQHLVLLSRRGPQAPGAADLIAGLRADGAEAVAVACDVTNREALAAVLSDAGETWPVRGVVHAAAVFDGDLPVAELTMASLAGMTGPKAVAAQHLHDLTVDLPLDGFVLFSSGAGVWGGGGQGGYAAANAYLDALAVQRRAGGLPATAVSWGAWGGAGAATDPAVTENLRRRGVQVMPADQAIEALERALVRGDTALTVTAMDWQRFAETFTATRPSPLLSELPEVVEALREDRDDDEPAGGTPLRQELEAMAAGDRVKSLLQTVRLEAARALGHDGADAIPAGRAMRDLGFDSVSAVELRNRLRVITGLALPAALVFDYPTSNALSQHLHGLLFPGGEGTTEPADPDAEIRAVLAAVPIGRLRRAGLLDLILRMANDDTSETGGSTSIDDMDGASLLRMVSENTTT